MVVGIRDSIEAVASAVIERDVAANAGDREDGSTRVCCEKIEEKMQSVIEEIMQCVKRFQKLGMSDELG